MPSLHKNSQLCAEYLFLVLIYHGFFVVGFFVIVSFCFALGLAFLPLKKDKKKKKEKKKNSKELKFIFKILSLKILIKGEGLYMIWLFSGTPSTRLRNFQGLPVIKIGMPRALFSHHAYTKHQKT